MHVSGESVRGPCSPHTVGRAHDPSQESPVLSWVVTETTWSLHA